MIDSIKLGSILSVYGGRSNGLSGYYDGVGTNALFHTPFGIVFDTLGANLYVCDKGNHMIRKINIASGTCLFCDFVIIRIVWSYTYIPDW